MRQIELGALRVNGKCAAAFVAVDIAAQSGEARHALDSKTPCGPREASLRLGGADFPT